MFLWVLPVHTRQEFSESGYEHISNTKFSISSLWNWLILTQKKLALITLCHSNVMSSIWKSSGGTPDLHLLNKCGLSSTISVEIISPQSFESWITRAICTVFRLISTWYTLSSDPVMPLVSNAAAAFAVVLCVEARCFDRCCFNRGCWQHFELISSLLFILLAGFVGYVRSAWITASRQGWMSWHPILMILGFDGVLMHFSQCF